MAAMDEIMSYLADVEAALISSPAIADFEVVRSWANTDDGYIRVQATLANSDFLEASEHFAFQGGYLVTRERNRRQANEPDSVAGCSGGRAIA